MGDGVKYFWGMGCLRVSKGLVELLWGLGLSGDKHSWCKKVTPTKKASCMLIQHTKGYRKTDNTVDHPDPLTPARKRNLGAGLVAELDWLHTAVH